MYKLNAKKDFSVQATIKLKTHIKAHISTNTVNVLDVRPMGKVQGDVYDYTRQNYGSVQCWLLCKRFQSCILAQCKLDMKKEKIRGDIVCLFELAVKEALCSYNTW